MQHVTDNDNVHNAMQYVTHNDKAGPWINGRYHKKTDRQHAREECGSADKCLSKTSADSSMHAVETDEQYARQYNRSAASTPIQPISGMHTSKMGDREGWHEEHTLIHCAWACVGPSSLVHHTIPASNFCHTQLKNTQIYTFTHQRLICRPSFHPNKVLLPDARWGIRQEVPQRSIVGEEQQSLSELKKYWTSVFASGGNFSKPHSASVHQVSNQSTRLWQSNAGEEYKSLSAYSPPVKCFMSVSWTFRWSTLSSQPVVAGTGNMNETWKAPPTPISFGESWLP